MFDLFIKIADQIIDAFHLSLDTSLGKTIHFFIQDILTIFMLIYLMLFFVSLFRSQISPEKVKSYLSGKSKILGYFLAVILGAITPFCSCSSIPLFISFVAAGIPFGITMTFLIASPLISEIATIILLGTQDAGIIVATVYILTGASIAIIGGWLCDLLNLERLSYYDKNLYVDLPHSHYHNVVAKMKAIVLYAWKYTNHTVRGIALYVFIGVAIGAVMHGYIPNHFFEQYLGRENIFAVPLAVLIGIPMYANHNSVIPIIQVLLLKGVPVGTALATLMSITAISLPEIIMLHKVLTWKMLLLFVLFLIVSFILVGYILNWLL